MVVFKPTISPFQGNDLLLSYVNTLYTKQTSIFLSSFISNITQYLCNLQLLKYPYLHTSSRNSTLQPLQKECIGKNGYRGISSYCFVCSVFTLLSDRAFPQNRKGRGSLQLTDSFSWFPYQLTDSCPWTTRLSSCGTFD